MATRRISVTLTEQEYEALKAEAERERRTIAQQAAYRLTRPDPDEARVIQPFWPSLPHVCPTGLPTIPAGTIWWQRTDNNTGDSLFPKSIYD